MKDRKQLLDKHYKWPAPFRFKFIMPESSIVQFEALLSPVEIAALERRPSENGRFTGFTLTLEMNSSDAVMAVYERVKAIPGLISL